MARLSPFLRLMLTLPFVFSAAVARTQLLHEDWKQTESTHSDNDHGAFIKNGRTVHLESNPGGPFASNVVCREANGTLAWTYPMPLDAYGVSLLATTDNLIYVTGQPDNSPRTPYVLCLDQDGAFQWGSLFNYGNAVEKELTEMRIFGDSLLIAGRGRLSTAVEGSRLCVFSINRFSGMKLYDREYLFGNVNMPYQARLRSDGTFAYIMGVKGGFSSQGGTGVLKIDPSTGDVLGSYVAAPYTARDIQVDSAKNIYLSGLASRYYYQPDIRKINGSGMGAMPLVYRKLYGGNQMLLSGGSMFVNEYRSVEGQDSYGFRKVRLTDGASIWYRSGSANDGIWMFRGDSFGNLFGLRRLIDAEGVRWSLNVINPANGEDLESIEVASSLPDQLNTIPRHIAINTHGEIFVTGTEASAKIRHGVAARFFQSPASVDDTYSVVEGQTFNSGPNGGVLANDKCNPYLTGVSVIEGPAEGTLQMLPSGQFTYKAQNGNGPLPTGTQTFRYRATRGNFQTDARVTLKIIRALTNFTITRSMVAGDGTNGGIVTLSSTGPTSTVALTEDSPYVTMPTTLAITSGSPWRGFNITFVEVSSTSVATLAATFGGVTKSVTMTLEPLQIASMNLSPSNVIGGNDIACMILLNGRATTGGIPANISDNHANVLSPGEIMIPAGAAAYTVHIPTTHVLTTAAVKITVTGLGSTNFRYVNIKP